MEGNILFIETSLTNGLVVILSFILFLSILKIRTFEFISTSETMLFSVISSFPLTSVFLIINREELSIHLLAIKTRNIIIDIVNNSNAVNLINFII